MNTFISFLLSNQNQRHVIEKKKSGKWFPSSHKDYNGARNYHKNTKNYSTPVKTTWNNPIPFNNDEKDESNTSRHSDDTFAEKNDNGFDPHGMKKPESMMVANPRPMLYSETVRIKKCKNSLEKNLGYCRIS